MTRPSQSSATWQSFMCLYISLSWAVLQIVLYQTKLQSSKHVESSLAHHLGIPRSVLAPVPPKAVKPVSATVHTSEALPAADVVGACCVAKMLQALVASLSRGWSTDT